MTRYLLDTNICIELLRRRSTAVLRRLRRLRVQEAAISSVTFAELMYGVFKSARPAHHAALLGMLCVPIEILPFDNAAAMAFGQVRSDLERLGTPIGPIDTLIASHAIALDVPLVTTNEREFRRVRKLRVENWTRAV